MSFDTFLSVPPVLPVEAMLCLKYLIIFLIVTIVVSQVATAEIEEATEPSVPPAVNESLTIESLFLPQSLSHLGEPFNSILKFITRMPIRLVAWILGENADILGLQMQQIGNALISVGAESLGLGFKDYGLNVMAFGRVIKEWFVNENIPPAVTEALRKDPAYYQWWDALGQSYLETRTDLEKMYSSQF